MSRAGSPFSPRAVIGLLTVGAGAFLLLLYAIGAGWTGSESRDGGAHAASNSVNGFSGLARLLEARGQDVSLTRSESRLDDDVLLILTPQILADGERIGEIIEARRYQGPTLLILPKWFAIPAAQLSQVDGPPGWVVLGGATAPGWLEDAEGFDGVSAEIAERRRWDGLDLTGSFAAPEKVLGLELPHALPLVTDEQGDMLAGYLDDGGYYPVLDEAAGMPERNPEDLELDESRWAVVVVAEPDLMNNYGMADRVRAELAERIVVAAMEGQDLPIVFDLTVPGLGQSQNLLTLAFRPPFVAATLCLLLAALVVAWRALRRFGPPVAEAPALAMGKRQLARNAAGLIERARRYHLLGPPYAAMVAARLAAALGIREADPAARDEAIDRALAQRGIATDYPQRAEAVRHARHRGELVRAAGALHFIERTLDR